MKKENVERLKAARKQLRLIDEEENHLGITFAKNMLENMIKDIEDFGRTFSKSSGDSDGEQ